MVDGKIIQGTTPVFSFSLPVPLSEIINIRFSFSQRNELILTKEMNECEVQSEEEKVIVHLSQEESYLFESHKGNVKVRMRIMLQGEQVITSDEIVLRVENNVDKVVMKNE